jgi:hypothetical protein
MNARRTLRTTIAVATASLAMVALGYGAYAAAAWYRYGPRQAEDDENSDTLLDEFMPTFEVVERHEVQVLAPASVTFAVAREQDLFAMPLIKAIFRARELALGAHAPNESRPRGLVAHMQALGWGVLAEVADREIVVGAVTKPWEPDVRFQSIPAADFRAYAEPGFVKIVWTLRVQSIEPGVTLFRTETRAIATDEAARKRFRKYWAFASPGIALIRRLSLAPLRREAERRAGGITGDRSVIRAVE